MAYALVLWALLNQIEERPLFVAAHRTLVDCQVEAAAKTLRFKEELATDTAKNRGVMFICSALVPSA